MNNVNKFEAVDLEDLKKRFPSLNLEHLVIDTTSDLEDEWFVISQVTR